MLSRWMRRPVKAADAVAGPGTGFGKKNPVLTPKFAQPDGGDLHVPGVVRVKKQAADPAANGKPKQPNVLDTPTPSDKPAAKPADPTALNKPAAKPNPLDTPADPTAPDAAAPDDAPADVPGDGDGAAPEYGEMSFEALRDALAAELGERWGAGPYGPGPYLLATYPDRCVYQTPDGSMYQTDYVLDADGDDVVLGDTVEVQVSYVPVPDDDQADGQDQQNDPMGGPAAGPVARVVAGEVVGGRARAVRLFLELSRALSEPPTWMPVLPKPGTYTHPRWGEIDITAERIARFVANFNAGVYQTNNTGQPMVPVDAEHETKASGACGWIVAMRVNGEGGADARVDWTDRGRSMIEADRFRFVSPEWYPEWEDPATNEVFRDVLIGAALTTRPFFKTNAGGSALPALAAHDREERDRMPDQTLTKLRSRLAAVEAERDAARHSATAATEASRSLSERVRAIESERRRDRYTAEVIGQSDANHRRWFGEPERHVSMLERLADTFGEDSDELRQYVEHNRATAEQLHTSGLFREHGRTGIGQPQGGVTERFNALVAAEIDANPALSAADAIGRVAAKHPQLYHEHASATQVRIG